MILYWVRNSAAEQEEAMKWHEYYREVWLDERGFKYGRFWAYLSSNDPWDFPFRIITQQQLDDPNFDAEGPLFDEAPVVRMILLSVSRMKETDEFGDNLLRVVVKTHPSEPLPRGVRHGTYELTFSFGMDAIPPSEMFEDEEVPHDFVAKRDG